jgi:hypothetical protein
MIFEKLKREALRLERQPGTLRVTYMTNNKMKVPIKLLKKGSRFKFNDTIYIVKQKFSDWRKDDEPYLTTFCGEVFWFDELEVELED